MLHAIDRRDWEAVRAAFADTAEARCAITAKHRIDDSFWTVGGHYQIQLEKNQDDWNITHLTLDTAYQDGDRGLTEQAAQRASG